MIDGKLPEKPLGLRLKPKRVGLSRREKARLAKTPARWRAMTPAETLAIRTTKKSQRRGAETRGRKRMQTVHLTIMHCINGIRYGPGTLLLPEDVACEFRDREQKFKDSETYLYQQGSAIIGAGSRVIRMPTQFFESELATVLQGRQPSRVASWG